MAIAPQALKDEFKNFLNPAQERVASDGSLERYDDRPSWVQDFPSYMQWRASQDPSLAGLNTEFQNQIAQSGQNQADINLPQMYENWPTGQHGSGFAGQVWQGFTDLAKTFGPLVLGGYAAGAYGGAGTAAAGAGAGTGTAGALTAAEEAAMLTGAGAGGGATGFTAAGTTVAGSSGLGGFTGGNPAYGLGEEAIGATGGMAGTGSIPSTTAATTASGATALSRILDGSGTTQDYLSLAGQVAPSLLGMYASGKQTDALQGLAGQYMEMGAPYRSRLAEISADPNAFYNSQQAQQATESVLRRLSATHGNVAGSPYGQALTIDALAGEYGRERDRLAGYGGLTAFNSAAPGAATAAIGSQANFYNALGGGIADVTTPRTQPRTLAEILRAGGYA